MAGFILSGILFAKTLGAGISSALFIRTLVASVRAVAPRSMMGDTSEVYIRMVDCPEIQEQWQDATLAMLPSLVWDSEIERVCVMIWQPETLKEKIGIETTNSLQVSIEWDKPLQHWTPDHEFKKTTIWLPMQHQLQAMHEKKHPLELLDNFHSFCMWDESLEDIRENLALISREQLEIRFLMHELHGKVWTDGGWQSAD